MIIDLQPTTSDQRPVGPHTEMTASGILSFFLTCELKKYARFH